MKFFKILVSPKYKGKHQKRAVIKEITYKNTIYNWADFNYKYNTLSVENLFIDEIVLEIRDASAQKQAPFPNFMSVMGSFFVVDKDVINFLNLNNIPFHLFKTKIIESKYSYFFIYFKKILITNKTASNIEIKNNKVVGKNGMLIKEIVIEHPKSPESGIFSLDIFPNIAICDEITKQELEKERFTGLVFKEIKTS